MLRNNLEVTLHLVTCPMTASMHAWNSNFRGDAAKALLNMISNLLSPEIQSYARAPYIINSSGTGKSRMVDEVSKSIITVPICLRRVVDVGAKVFHPSFQFFVVLI